MTKWHRSNYPGVRFKYHDTRKYKNRRDKYFTIRYYVGGKQKEEGLGWASQKWTAEKANKTLVDLKAEIKTGSGITSLKDIRKKVELEIEKELRIQQIEEEDRLSLFQAGENYLSSIKTINPVMHKREVLLFKNQIYIFFGKDTPIKSITTANLEKFRDHLLIAGSIKKKPLAPRTVEYCLTTMSKLFKCNNLTPIASHVKVPKYDNKAERHLSKEEIALLLPELQSRSEDLYNCAIMALHLGFRAGEVFSLKVMHVNFSQGNVRAFDTKNKKTRTIYMTNEVKLILEKCCKGKKPRNLVFPDRNGNKRVAISDSFDRAANKVKLNEGISDRRLRATFHTLRHTYASWLIMSGNVDLYTLQKLLGHQDIKTTQRYAHLAPDHYRESASVMESEFSQVELSEKV